MGSAAVYDCDELEKKLCVPTAPPICLPLHFLKDVTCNFSTERELGRGGYGVVYKGVLWSGRIIAVKKIFSIRLVEDNQFKTEVRNLININHKHIVKLVGYCAESRLEAIKMQSGNHAMVPVPTRLLCFEYLCNKSLDKHISDESSGLDWYKRFRIIKGISSGLHFLHEKHIVHLDLKPGNILLDATMMPKIADFGLSRLLGTEKSRTIISRNRVGSLGYMAPEYIYQGEVSPMADIFSFGIIMIEIITGYKTINGGKFLQPSDSHQSTEISRQQYIENVVGRWRKIFKKEKKYTSPEIYTQQVKECITIALRCVDDKSRRPSALEIFQNLDAVESTNCHEEDSKNSVVYPVQDDVRSGLVRIPRYMDRLDVPIEDASGNGNPLKITVVNVDTGSPAARMELFPLFRDVPGDGSESWDPMRDVPVSSSWANIKVERHNGTTPLDFVKSLIKEQVMVTNLRLRILDAFQDKLLALHPFRTAQATHRLHERQQHQVRRAQVTHSLHEIAHGDLHAVLFGGRVRLVQRGRPEGEAIIKPLRRRLLNLNSGAERRRTRTAPNSRRERALQQPPRGRHR